MNCKYCGQIIVRMDDGSPDCGCTINTFEDAPEIGIDSEVLVKVSPQGNITPMSIGLM